MRPIIYYVASSIDGYISGPNEDNSAFDIGGNGVDQYLADLQAFDTVIMGRRTYEYGYEFGIKPGQPAYPHMRHYIFSNKLHFDQPHELVQACPLDLSIIEILKQEEGSPIYLCGGGIFAAWLLEHELIDELKLKLNPLILGDGIRIFGEEPGKPYRLELKERTLYDNGLQFLHYQIQY